MRPIDADNLFKQVVKECESCQYNQDYCNKDCNIRYFISLIRTSPTLNRSDIVSFYNKGFKESIEYKTGYSKGYQEGLIYVLNDLKNFIQEYD